MKAKEFEKDYFITNKGKVFTMKNGSLKELKGSLHSKGYLKIKTCNQSKYTCYYIHRLVGLNFVKGYKPELQINHKDGDKLNNNYKNLEWCTCKHNIQHSYKTGLRDEQLRTQRGEKIYNSKLTNTDVKLIRIMLKENQTHENIANNFNVAKSTITKINLGQTWSHI